MTYNIRQESDSNGFLIIELTDGEFAGVSYTYSKVSISEGEDNGDGILHYDYNIVDGEVFEVDKKRFEKIIGDILMKELEKQISQSKVIYSGGTE